MNEFTPRQLRAINNYMKGMSQRQALLGAGYSMGTANNNPDSVFDNPKVVAEIKRRQQKMIEASELSEKWIVERLMTIADANLGDLIDFDDDGCLFINYNKLSAGMKHALAVLDVEQGTAGRGITARPVTRIKIRPADKLRALEMLMKYLGLEKTNVNITGDQELVNRLYRARELANSSSSSSSSSDA